MKNICTLFRFCAFLFLLFFVSSECFFFFAEAHLVNLNFPFFHCLFSLSPSSKKNTNEKKKESCISAHESVDFHCASANVNFNIEKESDRVFRFIKGSRQNFNIVSGDWQGYRRYATYIVYLRFTPYLFFLFFSFHLIPFLPICYVHGSYRMCVFDNASEYVNIKIKLR